MKYIFIYIFKNRKKGKNAAKTECNSERQGGGLGWVGEERRGKKWAGLVRLIAPELCRKNKLSCRRRAELGWAERGRRIAGGGLSWSRLEDPSVPDQEARHITLKVIKEGVGGGGGGWCGWSLSFANAVHKTEFIQGWGRNKHWCSDQFKGVKSRTSSWARKDLHWIKKIK